MARLQEEVRSAFTRYEEIDSASTIPLKYLKAVAQEAMRIYPPLPFALPRVVPEPGCHVDGKFLPGGVRIPLFSPLPCLLRRWYFFPTDGVCMYACIFYRLSFPPALSLQVCLLRISIGLGSLSLSVGWRRARAAMLLRPVSHFPTVVEHVWAEGTCIPGEWHSSSYCLLEKEKERNADKKYYYCSLGWTELMTTMAKMIYTYDLELVDQKLDWHGDSRMHTVWEKPSLMVKVSPRK